MDGKKGREEEGEGGHQERRIPSYLAIYDGIVRHRTPPDMMTSEAVRGVYMYLPLKHLAIYSWTWKTVHLVTLNCKVLSSPVKT